MARVEERRFFILLFEVFSRMGFTLGAWKNLNIIEDFDTDAGKDFKSESI